MKRKLTPSRLLKNNGGMRYDIACAQLATRLFFSDKDSKLTVKKNSDSILGSKNNIYFVYHNKTKQ
jgi:hypothetical protein